MPNNLKTIETTAPVERKMAAPEQAFEKRNLISNSYIDNFERIVEEPQAEDEPISTGRSARENPRRKPVIRLWSGSASSSAA